MKFNREAMALYPGALIRVRSKGFWGMIIRRALNIRRKKWLVWSNHIGVNCPSEGGIGDSAPGGARVTSYDVYEALMDTGYYQVEVEWPLGATYQDGSYAENWWLENVKGTPYDYYAFPRLLFKAVCGDWWKKAAGMEWANWCVEGGGNAWKYSDAGIDLYHNENPTPLTHEKRLYESITFRTITNSVLE